MATRRDLYGRPPNARRGERFSVKGRAVQAGVAPHARLIPARATDSDLWAPLDALTYTRGRLTPAEMKRFGAFTRQARQYYGAVFAVEPVAKPLVAYYFMLNLSKAFLTWIDPSSTASRKMRHGLHSNETTARRYHFSQEVVVVESSGVFRFLASRSGQGFCWAAGYSMPLTKLLPYLVEGFDLLQDSGRAPSLLPVSDVYVLGAKERPGGSAWLRVEVQRETLDRHGIQPSTLVERAAIFGASFRRVHDGEDPSTCSFESEPVRYAKRQADVLPGVVDAYDRALLGFHRGIVGGRHYITVSKRPNLLSHEAVSFAVMLHLSNMVRYRPHRVEALLEDRNSWLLRAWVDRAVENFLLAMSSRIVGEDQVIG